MTPGDRFGYLVVLAPATRRSGGQRFRCLCACGAKTVQDAHDLRHERVVSCGCVGRLGRIAATNARNVRRAHEAQLESDRQAAAAQAQREAGSGQSAVRAGGGAEQC